MFLTDEEIEAYIEKSDTYKKNDYDDGIEQSFYFQSKDKSSEWWNLFFIKDLNNSDYDDGGVMSIRYANPNGSFYWHRIYTHPQVGDFKVFLNKKELSGSEQKFEIGASNGNRLKEITYNTPVGYEEMRKFVKVLADHFFENYEIHY
jgi:hypothetical protein